MAIQILPKTGLGERLGTALGTGLSSGLQGLLQSKLNDIQQQKGLQQTRSGLESLGIEPGIASLPQNLQDLVVKQLLQQPGQQSYANALSSLLGGQNNKKEGETSTPNLTGLNQQQTSELARLGLQKQKAATQEKQFETKEARIRQHASDKETKPYYDEITNGAKAAKENNQRLNRMQTLLNKGDLTNPAFYTISRKIGFDIPAFLNADSQEFNKLSKDFLRSAKSIFGSRLTNLDVSSFLQTVPELAQSDEGKQRIINNMKIFNAGSLLRNEALNKIIDANGGVRPSNISQLVEKAVEPQLDQLAEMFTKGTPLGKSVRKSEESVQNANPTMQLAQNAQPGPQNQQNEPLSQIPLYGTQLSQTPKQEPSALQETGRHIGRTSARVLESLAGIPGDLASTGLSLANALTGGRIPRVEAAQNILPTSTNLRELTKDLTGNYLEPQSEKEKIADDLASDFASFALPIKGKIPFKSAFIKSLGGNTASFLSEKLGAGPLGKGIAKVGTVLLYSFSGGRKALNKVMEQSYKNTDALAGTAKEGAKELGKDITTLTKDLTTGIKTPGKTFVADSIKGISEYIKNGKIAVKDVIKSEKEINELLRDPQTPVTAKKYLGRLSESFSKILNSYGKSNPEFGKAYNESKDIYRGLHKASDIAQTIQKSVKPESLTSNLIKSILTFTALKNPATLPIAGTGLGIGVGIQKLTKFGQLLKNSKEARKYYLNILKAAAHENSSLVQRNAMNLDKLATKEGY